MALRILGLDPGLRHTGWGIIQLENNHIQHVAHGVVSIPTTGGLAARLRGLFQGLEEILARHQPMEAAVEETFVNMNASSTLKLGSARGVVLLAPAIHGLEVFEYATNQVKKAVVGVGHADKNQVSRMVQTLLPRAGEVTLDAADALAVALCHAHFRQTSHRISTQQVKELS